MTYEQHEGEERKGPIASTDSLAQDGSLGFTSAIERPER